MAAQVCPGSSWGRRAAEAKRRTPPASGNGSWVQGAVCRREGLEHKEPSPRGTHVGRSGAAREPARTRERARRGTRSRGRGRRRRCNGRAPARRGDVPMRPRGREGSPCSTPGGKMLRGPQGPPKDRPPMARTRRNGGPKTKVGSEPATQRGKPGGLPGGGDAGRRPQQRRPRGRGAGPSRRPPGGLAGVSHGHLGGELWLLGRGQIAVSSLVRTEDSTGKSRRLRAPPKMTDYEQGCGAEM